MQLSFTPKNNSIGRYFSQQIEFFLGLNLPKPCKLYVFSFYSRFVFAFNNVIL